MPARADVVIEAGKILDFRGPESVTGSVVALAGGRVVATGETVDDLDVAVDSETKVIKDHDLVLSPSYFDTHNHLCWTSTDVPNVDISDARSIDEIIVTLRQRAVTLPEGTWVIAARGWHESTIREKRLPTARELDAVSDKHPVFVQRGGHVATANTHALRLSGILDSTVDPSGSTVVRDADGRPLGPLIEFPAMQPIQRLLPRAGHDGSLLDLATTFRRYNAKGLTAVRDPGITEANYRLYEELHAQGDLSVRVRPLFMMDSGESYGANMERLQTLQVRPGEGDDVLRAEGIKIIADGGVEGGWVSDPYVNRADFCGHAFYSREELESLVETAVRRGWKVGTHAVGDNTVRLVLDVYESVLSKVAVKPGSLVVEHAFMADAQSRARAVAAGIRVTVQHPLLYFLGGNMLTHWGPERTAHVMPVAEWLADGGLVAGGSDCNVAPYDPLLAIWGFTTRGTKVAGVQGPSQAVDRRTAFGLYTEAGWRLPGEGHERGRLLPGFSADLVAYRQDPMSVDLDDLPSLSPAFTLMAGNPVYDPEGYFHDDV
jgi:predicted amidohydrolase YtcJ